MTDEERIYMLDRKELENLASLIASIELVAQTTPTAIEGGHKLEQTWEIKLKQPSSPEVRERIRTQFLDGIEHRLMGCPILPYGHEEHWPVDTAPCSPDAEPMTTTHTWKDA